MTRELLLSQEDTKEEKSRKQRYFNRMQKLYQYDLNAPYFSFNGNIPCLSTTGINKWLVVLPSFKLTLITTYKFVMMIIAGIYAWLKSVKG